MGQAVNLRAGIRVRGATHVRNVNIYSRRIRSPQALLKATLGAFPHLTVT